MTSGPKGDQPPRDDEWKDANKPHKPSQRPRHDNPRNVSASTFSQAGNHIV